MFAEERKQRILGAIQRDRSVRVDELGRVLRASPASIRRDLAELERAGLLRRTHGGAIGANVTALEPSLAQKEDQYQAEKLAIARVAASFVRDGDTICLDSGSTTRQLARELRHRRITVVTNALNIAWELAASECEVVLTGGHLRRGILSQVGPIAEQALKGLHVDKLFLAANGVDLTKGVTTPNLIEAQTKQAMVKAASEVLLLVDRSKFGRVTFARICPLDSIHQLITDEGAPAAVLRAIDQLGVRVHLAADRRAASHERGSA
jgi:DeoR family transcriptional regulator, fructose operon transcriptional repressor